MGDDIRAYIIFDHHGDTFFSVSEKEGVPLFFIYFISIFYLIFSSVLILPARYLNEMVIVRPEFVVRGDSRLLEKSSTVILNSRQTKTPVGTDLWVIKTVEACREAIEQGRPVIASIGMNTWELVLWAVGEYGGQAIVICPLESGKSIEETIVEIAFDFNLELEKHAWIFIPDEAESGKSRSGKSWWKARDRLAIELASNIVPVGEREGGFLDQLIEDWSGISEKNVDDRFRTKYSGKTNGELKFKVPDSCPIFENWNHLTHWTCRTYRPWPGETASEFYRAIANSGDEYPRSASGTLKRILAEGCLRGSGRHMRGDMPVVAFTSLEPVDALKLMKWRKRYVRPTFEPYGIAIFYRSAIKAGIRMVTYVKNGEETSEIVSLPELTQGYGTGDWLKEKEWRAIGDVDLCAIPEEDVIVLVPSEKEAVEFRKITEFRVIGLE